MLLSYQYPIMVRMMTGVSLRDVSPHEIFAVRSFAANFHRRKISRGETVAFRNSRETGQNIIYVLTNLQISIKIFIVN